MPRITLTKLEKKTIKYAFESTRKFWETPITETISLKNINNIILALNYLDNRIGVGTKTRGDIVKGIYDKFGLCRDGVTTKEERANQIKDAKKRELDNQKRARDKFIEALREQVINLEKKITEAQKTDEAIEASITAETLSRQATLKIEMDALRHQKQRDAEKDRKLFLASLGINIDELLTDSAPPEPPPAPEAGKTDKKKKDKQEVPKQEENNKSNEEE